MTYRKVGGLHFVKVWRFQFSWCKLSDRTLRRQASAREVERVFYSLKTMPQSRMVDGQRVLLPAR